VVSLMSTPSPDELKAIPGVINVDHLGGTRFRIQFADATEVTERIVAASVANNWRLMEINLEKNSLDTIFAELSKKKK